MFRSFSKLWRLYEQQLAAHPVPTQMATSCVLWGTGDILAQRIEHYEKETYGTSSGNDGKAIVVANTGQSSDAPGGSCSVLSQQQELHGSSNSSGGNSSSSSFRIDSRRTVLTAVGFGAAFVGPVGEYWYSGLEKVSKRLVPSGGFKFLVTKVVLDSAVMGSLYVAAFFAFSSLVLEGSGWQGVVQKMKVDFAPTYLAELAVWPPFQTFNFSLVPVRHQLLAVNTFSLLDAAFISWCGNQEDWLGKIMARMGLKDTASKDAASKQQ